MEFQLSIFVFAIRDEILFYFFDQSINSHKNAKKKENFFFYRY